MILHTYCETNQSHPLQTACKKLQVGQMQGQSPCTGRYNSFCTETSLAITTQVLKTYTKAHQESNTFTHFSLLYGYESLFKQTLQSCFWGKNICCINNMMFKLIDRSTQVI